MNAAMKDVQSDVDVKGMTNGYKQKAKDIVQGALFPEVGLNPGVDHAGGVGGLVVVRDINLFSYCESCLLPFSIKCHVGYVPSGGHVVGLSKLSRVADVFARRFQHPKRLASEVCAALHNSNNPAGVTVSLQCWHMKFSHLCDTNFTHSTISDMQSWGTVLASSSPRLKEHMEHCINHPEEMSKLSKLKAHIIEVKGIMMDNIEKAITVESRCLLSLLSLVEGRCTLAELGLGYCEMDDVEADIQSMSTRLNLQKLTKVPDSSSTINTDNLWGPLALYHACIPLFQAKLGNDENVLEENDIVKIDMGCHIDGFITVVAHTHVIQEGPVTGRAADVIAAANTAAEVALRLVRPGKKMEDKFLNPIQKQDENRLTVHGKLVLISAFTNLKYSRVEIDEVRFKWAECMLDYI
ncbi:hypothetical protein ZIOFF_060496 [Zingiber officinale]|uniref:GTP cyclohydrolase 1 n=1 Tax=Zingiber officinale TaxID=94328 RepID=A0A8J5KL81_ZINOF|nr:hypothetical protein ZIOFF_060496 [Zingiber officinale]